MKNWKLSVYNALIERLVSLAALEGSAQFQGVYLDALTDAVDERNQLRRSSNIHCKPLATVQPEHSCCARNA